MPPTIFESDTFDVARWDDPLVDRSGHAHDDPYVEHFWLPVLGPTATWLHRRLAAGLLASPGGFTVVVDDLARSLGVSSNGGRRSAFWRAVERCTMFGVVHHAHSADRPLLLVRTRLPGLARRHVERLPRTLRDSHPVVPRPSEPSALVASEP